MSSLESSEVLFSILGLHVTAEVTTTWGIMLVLVVVSIIATRHMKEHPTGLQNMLEIAITTLDSFISEIMGREKTDRYFAFFATMFIFIIVSNFCGLLPGAGEITGFTAPTASLSVTGGLAITVFLSIIVLGLQSLGIKNYLKHFFKPVGIMLPFILVDELVRPLSLALRLYGNIFGEESVTGELYNLFPIGPPLIMMIMSLLFCTIQAVVFTMLSAIYIDETTTLEE